LGGSGAGAGAGAGVSGHFVSTYSHRPFRHTQPAGAFAAASATRAKAADHITRLRITRRFLPFEPADALLIG
jgi:hypothetical protein